jgi:hypothetical protein
MAKRAGREPALRSNELCPNQPELLASEETTRVPTLNNRQAGTPDASGRWLAGVSLFVRNVMNIAKSLGAVTLAASIALTGVLPVAAAPLGQVANPGFTAPITLAASRDDMRRWDRGDRGGHYKGYNGSRNYRQGYRRNNDGWWYPLAAFGIGAAIGSTLSRPSGNSHVSWCASQYQSYRAWDNTYQPYNGPRRLCNSPYS